MISTRKQRKRSAARATKSRISKGGIPQFFQSPVLTSPGAIAAPPRGSSQDIHSILDSMGPQDSLPSAEDAMGTPADLRSVSPDRSDRPNPPGLEADIRTLLRALPTRQDIEELILRVEEAHRRDIQEVRAEVSSLGERVDSGAASVAALERRIEVLERSQASQADLSVGMQLHLEDLEDRGRRNNLRLRGIPEATGSEDLAESVIAIFREVLEPPLPSSLEIDRVHRALGPKSNDPERPRDVLCRLHRFSQKELILRQAWDHGPVNFDGASIKILPDVSRATLQRRALLRPVLELARQHGCTYRWGYPLAVTFRKALSTFTLRSPSDLPALFTFMAADPVPVPNWLQLIPRFTGRSGPSVMGGHGRLSQRGSGGRRRPAPWDSVRES